jgi:hypothetical protein
MSPAERRRAAHRKYNRSAKGKARYQRYEEAHPERATRWSPLMVLRGRGSAKWDQTEEEQC